MEEIIVKKWLEDNHRSSGYGSGYGSGFGDGDGDGSGYGSGYGDGDGYGDGSGYGYGSGFGDGYGSGSGFGSGFGDGDGDGSGYGYGSGFGDGDGYGYGYGDGYGLKSFDKDIVYMVDGVQTIINQIRGQVAKGYILNSDLTLQPCYIVKGNGYFAHGKTLKKAQSSLREKIFDNMDSEEAIEEFVNKFEKDKTYKGTEFFEWHHYLTGSCLMGRESFVKNHDLDLEVEYTVDEFIKLTENDYGSEIIKQLKERLEELWD